MSIDDTEELVDDLLDYADGAASHDHHDADADDLAALARTPTDDGNARALVKAHGRTLRYVSGLGWHEWDGQRWTPDREERVRELAKAVFREFPTDAKGFAHARYSLSAVGTSNALRQAQSDHRVRIAPDRLDADPYLLNTPAGIVDLTTGRPGPAAIEGHAGQPRPAGADPAVYPIPARDIPRRPRPDRLRAGAARIRAHR